MFEWIKKNWPYIVIGAIGVATVIFILYLILWYPEPNGNDVYPWVSKRLLAYLAAVKH